MKGIQDLSSLLPLFLDGEAFAVYEHMPEAEKNASKIEATLLNAFAMNPFAAYDTLRQRNWLPGESIDGYCSDLRRLAKLAKVEGDQFLKCAFISGLPTDISNQLRASSEISNSSLASILQQARVLMANRCQSSAFVSVSKASSSQAKSTVNGRRLPKCYKCGGAHVIRACPDIECFFCHEKGHMAKECKKNLNE